jgi:hypothetical protein
MSARFLRENSDALGADWAAVQLINQMLDLMEPLKKDTLNYVGGPSKSLLPWQIELYSESALHRISSLCDGCVESWNAGNGLISLLCTRAVVETTLYYWDYCTQLTALVQARNVAAIRALTMSRMFGGKEFTNDNPAYKITRPCGQT